MRTNIFWGKAMAIAMMLLSLTFVSCDEYDNPLPADWDGVTPDLPLTLETVAENGTMNITFTSTLPEVTTIEYSIDGGKSWRVFTISGGKPAYRYGDKKPWKTQAETPAIRTISGVHQILFKGNNESYGSTEKGDLPDDYINGNVRYLSIKVNADCYIYGNMMSLVGGDDFATKTELSGKCNFYRMFEGNASLMSHSSKKLLLPATTLTDSCYYSMFSGCSALTAAPTLPATTLKDYCYFSMFSNCTALTTAPALPATTMTKSCYREMFYYCTALTTAPDLPATTLADDCYNFMFSSCKALTTAPVLPAKELKSGCYQLMFQGCTNLNYVKCLATSIDATAKYSPTTGWLGDIPTGTLVKDASVGYGAGEFWVPSSSWSSSTTYCEVPPGWTVADAE